MRVFDSNKNKRWQGAGFAAKNDLLTILKTAKFHQNLSLTAGVYLLRAIGRKKVGGGPVIIEILDKNNQQVNSFKLDFGSANWTEQVFSFRVSESQDTMKIKVSRDPKSLGSVEISRLSLDFKNSLEPTNNVYIVDGNLETRKNQVVEAAERLHPLMANKVSVANDLNEKSSKLPLVYKKVNDNNTIIVQPELKPIIKNNFFEKNIAFVIDQDVTKFEFDFIKSIANELLAEAGVSFIYFNESVREHGDNFIIKSFKSKDELRLDLIKSNYSHVAYYYSDLIADLLMELSVSGAIKSEFINIKPYGRNKSFNPKMKYSFGINPGIFGDSPGTDKFLNVGINLDLFQPSNDSSIREDFCIRSQNKVLCFVLDEKNIESGIKYFNNLIKVLNNYTFILVSKLEFDVLKDFEDVDSPICLFKSLDDGLLEIIDILIIMDSDITNYYFYIAKAIVCGVLVFIDCEVKNGISLLKINKELDNDIQIINKNRYSSELISNGVSYILINHNIKDIAKEFKNEYLLTNNYKNINFKKITIKGSYV